VFDLIKISKFRGILVFPEGTSLNAMEKMIEKTKEFEFKEQTETQVTQYLIHKANIAMRTRDQPGIETML